MKRWILWSLAGLLVLYLGVNLLTSLIPLEGVREQLETGLDPGENWSVSIGRVELDLWAVPAVEVQNVRLYRRRPGSTLEILHIESASGRWLIAPLLRGERQVRLEVGNPRLLVAYSFSRTSVPDGEPTDLVSRQTLEVATAQTVREVLAVLTRMHSQVQVMLAAEAPGNELVTMTVNGGGMQLALAPLLSGPPVPVSMENVSFYLRFPELDAPGSVRMEGSLRVADDTREIAFDSPIVIEAREEGERIALPYARGRIGQTAFLMNALARQEGLWEETRIEFSVQEGLESLAPLWAPLVRPGLSWKVQGGAKLTASFIRPDGIRRARLQLDLTPTGILRTGWFHKAPGVPGRLELELLGRDEGLSVQGGTAALGGLDLKFEGVWAPGVEGRVAVEIQGRADDLEVLAGLWPRGDLAFGSPSGAVIHARVETLPGTDPVAVRIDLAELSAFSTQSDIHIAGQFLVAPELKGRVVALSNRFVPEDWLSKQGEDAFGPLATLLQVFFTDVETRMQLTPEEIVVNSAQGRWAGGPFRARVRYRPARCQGAGDLLLENASLEGIALRSEPDVAHIPEGITNGKLSVAGEFGRDLPCTARVAHPLDAWGANLRVKVEDLDFPMFSGETSEDRLLFERLLGARLTPIPRVQSVSGRIRMQGEQVRLESWEVDAGVVDARFSGTLERGSEKLDFVGELWAPRNKERAGEPFLAGVVVEGDRIQIPLQISGTWMSPRFAIPSGSEDLRESLMRLLREEAGGGALSTQGAPE